MGKPPSFDKDKNIRKADNDDRSESIRINSSGEIHRKWRAEKSCRTNRKYVFCPLGWREIENGGVALVSAVLEG